MVAFSASVCTWSCFFDRRRFGNDNFVRGRRRFHGGAVNVNLSAGARRARRGA
jgi:hypothetical protein